MTMEIAGDRPPRYDKKRLPLASVRATMKKRFLGPNEPKRHHLTMEIAGDRPLRYGKNRDREVSPTGETESLGVLRNPFDNNELGNTLNYLLILMS